MANIETKETKTKSTNQSKMCVRAPYYITSNHGNLLSLIPFEGMNQHTKFKIGAHTSWPEIIVYCLFSFLISVFVFTRLQSFLVFPSESCRCLWILIANSRRENQNWNGIVVENYLHLACMRIASARRFVCVLDIEDKGGFREGFCGCLGLHLVWERAAFNFQFLTNSIFPFLICFVLQILIY